MPEPSDVYLDWNATSPPHPAVLEAMVHAAREAWGNPQSVHGRGRAARAVVERTREALATLFDVHPRDVVFTSGGTEANNLALSGARALVTSRIEHPSVVRAAEALERAGRAVRWLPVPAGGRIEPESVERALSGLPAGATVALMAVNHETGAIQPVEAVAAICRSAGARLHVDAVQAVGKLAPERWRHGTSYALAAHKIRGPKGIGALAWRLPQPSPEPLFSGGAQERGLRPGTLDPVAVAGLGAALARLSELAAAVRALEPLRDRIERALAEHGLVNAGESERVPHVSNVSVEGWRGDELAAALDLAGVRISSGSACAAGTSEPSPVITAMLGAERAASAIRVSLGETTLERDVERAIAALAALFDRREPKASSTS